VQAWRPRRSQRLCAIVGSIACVFCRSGRSPLPRDELHNILIAASLDSCIARGMVGGASRCSSLRPGTRAAMSSGMRVRMQAESRSGMRWIALTPRTNIRPGQACWRSPNQCDSLCPREGVIGRRAGERRRRRRECERVETNCNRAKIVTGNRSGVMIDAATGKSGWPGISAARRGDLARPSGAGLSMHVLREFFQPTTIFTCTETDQGATLNP
jgi:hypothetical protein